MSYAWFLIIYPLLGTVLMWITYSLSVHPERVTNYFIKTAKLGGSPRLVIRWLRYFLLVSIVSSVISVFPLAWREFLFSLACLILIFVFGRFLLMWEQVKTILEDKEAALQRLTRKSGVLTGTMGVASFLLWYLLVTGA